MKVKYQEPNEALFDVANESLKAEILNRLSKLLSEGTRVAPIPDTTAAVSVETLFSTVQQHFAEIDDQGKPKPGHEVIFNTLNDEVQKLVEKQVKERLS